MSYNHIGSIIKNLIESLSDTSSAYGEVFEEVDNRMTVPGSAKRTLTINYSPLDPTVIEVPPRAKPRVKVNGEFVVGYPNSVAITPSDEVTLVIDTTSGSELGYEFYDYSGMAIDGIQVTNPREVNPGARLQDEYTFTMPDSDVEVSTSYSLAGYIVTISQYGYPFRAVISVDGETWDYGPRTFKVRNLITLSAEIKDNGYEFDYWSDGGQNMYHQNPFNLTKHIASLAPVQHVTDPLLRKKQVSLSIREATAPTKYSFLMFAEPAACVASARVQVAGESALHNGPLPCNAVIEEGATFNFSYGASSDYRDYAVYQSVDGGTTWTSASTPITMPSSALQLKVTATPIAESMHLGIEAGWEQDFESITAYTVSGGVRTPYTWGSPIPKVDTDFHIDIIPLCVTATYYVVQGSSIQTIQPSNPLSFDFTMSGTLGSGVFSWYPVMIRNYLTITVPESGTVTYSSYPNVSVPVSGTMKVGYIPGSTTLFCANPLLQTLVFDGWYVGTTRVSPDNSYIPTVGVVPAQSSIEAKYTQRVVTVYTLSKEQIVNGSITATVNGTVQSLPYVQVYEGDRIVITATPASGYDFGSFSGLPASAVVRGNVATFDMPAASVQVGATFNQQATFTGFTLQDGTHPTSSTTLEVPEHNAEVPVWVDTNADFTYWLTGDTSMFSVIRPLNNTFLIVRDIDPSNSNGENNAVLHVQVGSTERTLKLKKVIEFQGDYKTYTSDGNTSKAVSVSASAQTLTYSLQRGELWTSPTAGSTVLYWKGPRFPVDNTLSSNQCYYASSTDVPSSSNLVTVGSISGTGEDNRMQCEFLGSPNPYLSTDGSINLLSRSFLNYSVQINIPANTSGAPKYYVAKFYYTFSESLYFVIYQSA